MRWQFCEEYYGLFIGSHERFYQSSLAVSSFLFADISGSAAMRELAMSGAQYMLEVIDSSIEKAKLSVAQQNNSIAENGFTARKIS